MDKPKSNEEEKFEKGAEASSSTLAPSSKLKEERKIPEATFVVPTSTIGTFVKKDDKDVSFPEWEGRYRKRARRLGIIFTVCCILAVIWLLYIYIAGNKDVLSTITYTLLMWILVIVFLKFAVNRRVKQKENSYRKKAEG